MSDITEKYIAENFSFSTDDENEFYEFLSLSDEHTKTVSYRTDKATVLAVRKESGYKIHNGESAIPVWKIDPQKQIAVPTEIFINGKKRTVIVNERFQPAAVKHKSLLSRGDFRFAIDEAVRSEALIFYIEATNEIYFLSENAVATLCQRIKYDGGRYVPKQDRANEITQRMLRAKAETTAVIKIFNGVGKIYAFLSTKYMRRKLSEIKNLVKEIRKQSHMGKLEFVSGEYNHHYTRALFKFTDFGKVLEQQYGINMTPYIEIMNSDTGNASYTVSPSWKTPSSKEVFYSSRETYLHCASTISDEEIARHVFIEFRQYIRFLIDSKKKPLSISKDLIEKTVENVCEDSISVSVKAKAKNLISDEFRVNGSYTAYDLVKRLNSLPEIIHDDLSVNGKDLCNETYFKLRKKLAKVATLEL